MPELGPASIGAQHPPPRGSGARRIHSLAALILSIPVPGLGHAYAREPGRGLLLGLAYFLGAFLQGASDTLKTTTGFALFLLWKVGLGLFIIMDAARMGWKRTSAKDAPRSSSIASWAVAGVLTGIAFLQASSWFLDRYQPIKAFKVPSRSMCPTICEGDRMIVDTSAFKSQQPGRGDVIVFRPSSGEAPYIKRVIGVDGDVVKQGPTGTILVNGSPPDTRAVKGESPVTPDQLALFDFPETHVPAGSFFVVGDNLGNSLDSRVRGFGLIKTSQLIGRPLFLYWSSDRNRIGREIH